MRRNMSCLLPALLAGTAFAGSAGLTTELSGPPVTKKKNQPAIMPMSTGQAARVNNAIPPQEGVVPTNGVLKELMKNGGIPVDAQGKPRGTAGNAKKDRPEGVPTQSGVVSGDAPPGEGDGRDGSSKYEQPLVCGDPNGSYFSSLDNPWNRYIRVDDFFCNRTGNITAVDFQGGAWDMYYFFGKDMSGAGLTSMVVEIYEAVDGGACGWEVGEFLCGYEYPIAAILGNFVCNGAYSEIHYQFHAHLNPPCFQEEGKHYTLLVAGRTTPGSNDGFEWGSTNAGNQYTAFSIWTDDGSRACGGVDPAYQLLTDPTPCDGLNDPKAKWSQPINCTREAYFSNVNSNLNLYTSQDDFVCNLSGPITTVNVWGSCWDVCGGGGCPLPGSNVGALQVEIFDLIIGGDCGWRPGNVICKKVVPVTANNSQFVCVGPAGEQYYKVTLDLGFDCIQEEGRGYAIRVSGVLRDPNACGIWAWGVTCQDRNCIAFSNHPDFGCSNHSDHAFELFTPNPQKWCQEETCASNFCCFFSTDESPYNDYEKYDDFICTRTGGVTLIEFKAGVYDIVNFFGVDLLFSDVAGFVIEIFEWTNVGGCGWSPGEIVHRSFHTLGELNPDNPCVDFCGIPHYDCHARLREPWFQEEGRHYAISIRAVMNNPDLGQLGCLPPAATTRESIGYSVSEMFGVLECNMDMAFCLTTPIGGCSDCDGDGVCDEDEKDCNGDGTPDECDPNFCPCDLAPPFGVLNVFDFLSYQTLFGNEDPCADFTGEGNLNVFDFLAFQTCFGNGC